MFDPSKHMEMVDVSVGDFVAWLIGNVPMSAKINVECDNLFYTHVEKDGSVLYLDSNSLQDEYPEDKSEPCVYHVNRQCNK